ncbi:MAG: U32 family peptidase [Lachnospiraceae bacterium]|nr:U32 family peptidase [Lachnospiraceae bacterium]
MRDKNSKIELLAPAGSFQGFIGAINGGADAVYLAGNKFGARAFADNFTTDELCEVLYLAKLFNVKVYLTVNTLLKNMEMKELYDYIKPLYELGLTGVIIQDFGVFAYLKKHFSDLELHASTQMTITSLEGAKYLTEQGMKRVVLARELTLDEVKDITAAGIETECFIHGSMCYCYSGQCLLSSLIGGRSGNRGRCAQPCRLPYKINQNKQETYCLSLKDMCTLEYLPELIDSGITSFKIEGRMKNPAYAAYVTKMYRKYIDTYLSNPQKPYKVAGKDLERLKTLYIRTALHDGYYHKHRGADMITLESPAYSKTDESFVSEIATEMIQRKPQKKVRMQADFTVGNECTLYVETTIGEEVYSAYVTGDCVEKALKAPLSESAIAERLAKTGDSYFVAETIDVTVSGEVFLPVKAINELRRNALDALKETIILDMQPKNPAKERSEVKSSEMEPKKKSSVIAFSEEQEQLLPILQSDFITRVVLPYGWLLRDDLTKVRDLLEKTTKEVYFSLPAVCRRENYDRIHKALSVAVKTGFGTGVYVNQIDSMAYIAREFPNLQCVGDLNFYVMNNETAEWSLDKVEGYTIPVELNKEELRHLNKARGEFVLYGRTALMQTANCIFMTSKDCRKNKGGGIGSLTDRTGAKFPYRAHCEEKICYNTIYNSVPTSLHKHKKILDALGIEDFQLRFTVETKEETDRILDFYHKYFEGIKTEDAPFGYTNGHFLRGVE